MKTELFSKTFKETVDNGSHFTFVKLLYLPLILKSLVNKALLYCKKVEYTRQVPSPSKKRTEKLI